MLRDIAAILTFRASRARLLALGPRHLGVGLVLTWWVGMGRYWDDESASWGQHLGLGSVVYVLCLGTLLWGLTWPLRPADWKWERVVTFVAATSPPAILYAIPVEQIVSLPTAAALNVAFLAIVASWRVALLLWFFVRLGRLGWFRTTLAAGLPLALIVVTLAALNLERAVFSIMAGLRDHTANDGAYQVVVTLAVGSVFVAPVLVSLYAGTALKLWIDARKLPSPPPDP
ncbi:MAG: hypothetical protein AAGA56_10430 [Myxococcota bacterium]